MTPVPDPHRLAQRDRRIAGLLDDDGVLMLHRAHDWLPGPAQGDGHRYEPGDDELDETQRLTHIGSKAHDDQLEDRRAGRYEQELHDLLTRRDKDGARIERLHEILVPRRSDLTEQPSEGEPGCWSCARTYVAANVRRWAPIWRKVKIGEKRYDLCEACARRTYTTGQIPSTKDVEHKAIHGKWPRERVA